jgi:two-component system sensor kinase FixL
MVLPLYRGSKRFVLLVASSLIVIIALVDWRVVDDIPLGFLYLVPMLMLGRVLKPWQTVIAAAILTLLTEEFDPFGWNIRTGMPRDVLYFAAFLTIGIFVYETNRNRQVTLEHLREIERQSDARQEAEEQLKVLIESSPAAIVTTDSNGSVLMANDAAHRMLAMQPGTLSGLPLQRFFPALSNVSRRESSHKLFRTVMQSRGVREDGETFMADICFSTYGTKSGDRLAALILDSSEELRTREESSLHQVLAGSRIAVGAVSHEIRNVCGAISVVHQNLFRSPLLAKNKDFEALGNLVLALERIAAVDLQQYPESSTEVDMLSVLDDLKIVIAPSLNEESILCTWDLESNLPLVWADRTNLLQIFLNLTTNSVRALSQSGSERSLTISANSTANGVSVEFLDTGGGVANPEDLFHPFQPAAQATGLGLYLSRAFARSFGGDVRYKPLTGRACFVVELRAAPTTEETA